MNPISNTDPLREPRDGSKPVKAGCVIAFFGVFFLTGFGTFAGFVWGMVVPEWRANLEYLPNTCVVLDKRVASEVFDKAGTLYRPEILIRYEVNGRKYETWTYNAINAYSDGTADKHAIIGRFRVGAEYPCWYAPQNPAKAVLVRGYSWLPYVSLILPVVFMAIGGAGMYYSRELRGKTGNQLVEELAFRTRRLERGSAHGLVDRPFDGGNG